MRVAGTLGEERWNSLWRGGGKAVFMPRSPILNATALLVSHKLYACRNIMPGIDARNEGVGNEREICSQKAFSQRRGKNRFAFDRYRMQ